MRRAPLAPSTVSVVAQHLGQMMRSAAEDGLVVKNPTYRAKLPRRERTSVQPVPMEVVERIRTELPDWLTVAVALGVGVGLRQGEMSGLTVDRVLFLRRTLRVDRQLIDRNVPHAKLAPTKSQSSNRTVPVADFVVEALSEHFGPVPCRAGRPRSAGPPRAAGHLEPVRRAVAASVCGCRRAGARLPQPPPHLRLHAAVERRVGEGSGGLTRARLTGDHLEHLRPRDAGRRGVARSVLDRALAPSEDWVRTSTPQQSA